ncbi:hypothetical protein [Streptomyces umbrinus]|uniref:hypothetical protein n=1 Tax=Streptomyces umbrinus TaxID=67370 RepID=UPI0027D8CF9B|nr:hypothetical protein [Streptomyces umbrinus]
MFSKQASLGALTPGLQKFGAGATTLLGNVTGMHGAPAAANRTERRAPARIAVLSAQLAAMEALLNQLSEALQRCNLPTTRPENLFRRAAASGLPTWQRQNEVSTQWLIAQSAADAIVAARSCFTVVLMEATPVVAVAAYDAAVEFRGDRADPAEIGRLRRHHEEHAAQYDLLLVMPTESWAPISDPWLLYQALVDKHIQELLQQQFLDRVVVTSSPKSGDAAIWHAVEVGRQVAAA